MNRSLRRPIAALALALAACSGDPTPPAPTTADAEPPPSSPPAADPSPAQERHASSDGKVAAPRPSGDAWECEEKIAGAPDPDTTLIKCRHRDRARFFFMMAKDYAVPPDEVRTPEGIVRDVLPTTYGKLFERHTITRQEPVLHRGAAGVDLWIDAVHATIGPVRKRERVLTRGEHVFIISAEGMPEVFDGEGATIDAWFAGADFANLPAS